MAKKVSKLKLGLGIGGIIILGLAGAAGLTSASFVLNGRRQTLEEARAWQDEHYETGWYDELEKEDYLITSFDGYELHAELCKNPAGDAGKYVILTHGFSDNRFGSLKYMRIYLEKGYNCVIYDLRGHGENESTFCTYGIREGQDLSEVIHDTISRYRESTGESFILGIHGESLGAASSVACLKYDPEIEFVVADCGFSDIENVLVNGMSQQMPFAKQFIGFTSLMTKIRYGYALHDMRPVDSLPGNKVPILFIHGAKDVYILPSNSERMQEATDGYSELKLMPGAGHADSVLTDAEQYGEWVKAFLDKVEGDQVAE